MSHTAPGLVATYRVQLRNGVGLDTVRAHIPWLQSLGISHVYLSPLFTAATGSTHGYDVIDPNAVDPVLGGEQAFLDLSRAARAAGMGLVLDIVPNHMAFTPENPHLADIMRHGRESAFARLFDIDWSKGPLHFPVLDAAPDELLSKGQMRLTVQDAAPALRVYDVDYPLRDTPLAHRLAGQDLLAPDDLAELLEEQHWHIGHWRDTANDIVHRRFFNISTLVGVRQEDPEVFDFTHRWIISQVRAGRIQGLRVDHVDGLQRPGAYLRRLREAVGVLPIWVEKIVKEGETAPASWPIEGMSGYEFMAPVTQLLTAPTGLRLLREAAYPAVPVDDGADVRAVRQQLLATVFAPELERVTRAAADAMAWDDPDLSSISAAIAQLATHWPAYRSYAGDGLPLGQFFSQSLDAAKNDRMPSGALVPTFHLLSASDDPAARLFASRFEQLTGALTAKSEEDTLFFRSVAYLPFCEVGASPGLPAIDTREFQARIIARAEAAPCALTALSTHDTKRSADARAAIIALSYHPDLGARLYERAIGEARERGLNPRWGVYGVQCALMMHDQPDCESRLADHISKAMREAKDETSFEEPALELEERASALAIDLAQGLQASRLWSWAEREAFTESWHRLILAQLALQLTAPGVPDIYQADDRLSVSLTDPDNRRPADWGEGRGGDIGKRKTDLLRGLLQHRRARAELFVLGSYAIEQTGQGWIVKRRWQDQSFEMLIERPAVVSIATAG